MLLSAMWILFLDSEWITIVALLSIARTSDFAGLVRIVCLEYDIL